MFTHIIIPVYNQVSFTKQALNDLVELPDEDYAIIIVNNGSTDETVQEVNQLLSNRKNSVLINLDKNCGFSRAVNIGYTKSSSISASLDDLIIFLNNDIRVKPGYAKTWTKNLQDAVKDTFDIIVGPTAGFVNSKYEYVYETDDSAKQFNYISGWCLAGTRRTFAKFESELDNEIDGPFIDSFGTYFEDTFMGFEAKRLGIDMKIVDVPMVHFGRRTSRNMNLSHMYSLAKQKFIAKISSRDI